MANDAGLDGQMGNRKKQKIDSQVLDKVNQWHDWAYGGFVGGSSELSRELTGSAPCFSGVDWRCSLLTALATATALEAASAAAQPPSAGAAAIPSQRKRDLTPLPRT